MKHAVIAKLGDAVSRIDWERHIREYPGMLMVADLNHRIVLVSECFLKKFNYTPDMLLGKTDYEAAPHIQRQFFDEAAEHYRLVIESGKSSTYETSLQQPGGKLWFTVTIAPFHDNTGSVVGLARYITDTTGEKQLLDDIRKSSDRYRGVVDALYTMVIRFSPDDFAITFVNNAMCMALDMEREDIIGKSMPELVLMPEVRQEACVRLRNACASRRSYRKTHTHSFDNREYVVDWSITPIVQDETVVELQAAGTDVTYHVRRERLLHEREESFVAAAFRLLSPQQRTYILYAAAGMSAREIARAMDCEVETVYQYKYRIKQTLNFNDTILDELFLMVKAFTSLKQ